MPSSASIKSTSIVVAVYGYKSAIFEQYNGLVPGVDQAVNNENFSSAEAPGEWIIPDKAGGASIANVVSDYLTNGIPIGGLPGRAPAETGITLAAHVDNISSTAILNLLMSGMAAEDICPCADEGETGVNPYWHYIRINDEEYAIPIVGAAQIPLRIKICQTIIYNSDGEEEQTFSFSSLQELILNECQDTPINSGLTIKAVRNPGQFFHGASSVPMTEISDGELPTKVTGYLHAVGSNPAAVRGLVQSGEGDDRLINLCVVCKTSGLNNVPVQESRMVLGGQDNKVSNMVTKEYYDTEKFRSLKVIGGGSQAKYYPHVSNLISFTANAQNTHALPTEVNGHPVTNYAIGVLMQEIRHIEEESFALQTEQKVFLVSEWIQRIPSVRGKIEPLMRSAITFEEFGVYPDGKNIPLKVTAGSYDITIPEDGASAKIAASSVVRAFVDGGWKSYTTIDTDIPLSLSSPARTYPEKEVHIDKHILVLDTLNVRHDELFPAQPAGSAPPEGSPMRIPLTIAIAFFEVEGTPAISETFTIPFYVGMEELTSIEHHSHQDSPVGTSISNVRVDIRTILYSAADVYTADAVNEQISMRINFNAASQNNAGTLAFSLAEAAKENNTLVEKYRAIATTQAAAGVNSYLVYLRDWLNPGRMCQKSISITCVPGLGINREIIADANLDDNFGIISKITS